MLGRPLPQPNWTLKSPLISRERAWPLAACARSLLAISTIVCGQPLAIFINSELEAPPFDSRPQSTKTAAIISQISQVRLAIPKAKAAAFANSDVGNKTLASFSMANRWRYGVSLLFAALFAATHVWTCHDKYGSPSESGSCSEHEHL